MNKQLSFFVTLFNNELVHTDMFQKMARVTEGSPWHRENDVLTHTRMVVDEFLYRWPTAADNGIDGFCGALAAAFHDVGKPDAMVAKYKPERGDYFAFHGHEAISSRMFENWIASINYSRIVNGTGQHFDSTHIWKILWAIENHVPWEVKNNKLRTYLALSAKAAGPMFPALLIADQWGRISDDQDVKLVRVNDWMGEFMELVNNIETEIVSGNAPTLYMPIGPSGCGKSTFLGVLKNGSGDLDVYSWDKLRHEWYDANDYANAFKLSTEDSQFQSKANAAFMDILKTGKDVYVDNTNLTRKRRAFFLEAAHKRGYNTIAITFPVALQTLIARQATRGDKNVPEEAVRRQYMSLQQPFVGEFHKIHVSTANLYM